MILDRVLRTRIHCGFITLSLQTFKIRRTLLCLRVRKPLAGIIGDTHQHILTLKLGWHLVYVICYIDSLTWLIIQKIDVFCIPYSQCMIVCCFANNCFPWRIPLCFRSCMECLQSYPEPNAFDQGMLFTNIHRKGLHLEWRKLLYVKDKHSKKSVFFWQPRTYPLLSPPL